MLIIIISMIVIIIVIIITTTVVVSSFFVSLKYNFYVPVIIINAFVHMVIVVVVLQ